MKHGLVIVLIAGCSFPTPSEQYACVTTADCDGSRECDQGFCVVPGGNAIDAGADAPPSDTGPRFACAGWTPRHFDPCVIPQPTGPLALTAAGTYTYDTTTGMLKDTAGNPMTSPPSMIIIAGGGRIVSVDSLDLGPTSILRVTGMEPLILAAWTTISVSGTVDTSSSALGAGAGANPAGCAARAAIIGQSNLNGAGGGGGGGFSAMGGRGGDCNNGGAGGTGGTLVAVPLLLGGCAGANGGAGEQLGGVGGAGGGAVQLTARMGITLAGTARIHAGGSGGAGASSNGNEADGGGGGGGAGGMIGLQGATITVTAGAILAANGGGGGQGANNQPGGRGTNGQLSAARAPGGSGGDAGNGGPGGALVGPNGQGGNNDSADGGGGGGGGTGYIVLTSTAAAATGGATISPAPTVVAP